MSFSSIDDPLPESIAVFLARQRASVRWLISLRLPRVGSPEELFASPASDLRLGNHDIRGWYFLLRDGAIGLEDAPDLTPASLVFALIHEDSEIRDWAFLALGDPPETKRHLAQQYESPAGPLLPNSAEALALPLAPRRPGRLRSFGVWPDALRRQVDFPD